MNATCRPVTPLQRVIEVIEATAKARFDDASIDSVNVVEDGERDVLQVVIVFEDSREPDADRMVSFIRELCDALEDHAHESRFPVVSYVPKSEAHEVHAEA